MAVLKIILKYGFPRLGLVRGSPARVRFYPNPGPYCNWEEEEFIVRCLFRV
jgi:hypothetical protein